MLVVKKKTKVVKKEKFFLNLSEETVSLLIRFSKRNIRSSLIRSNGDVLSNYTSGIFGFKSQKKRTSSAANELMSKIIHDIENYKINTIKVVFVNFFYLGEEMINSLIYKMGKGIRIISISDKTPFVFGGTRPRAPRSR